MKIKQKIIQLALILSMATGIMVATVPSTVMAECDKDNATPCCGGVNTAIIACSQKEGAKTAETNAIWGVLLLVLNVMTAGIGIVAVGGIVYGGILYASAGDKAEQTKKAVGVITNVIIGLAAYGLMYLLLNFLIPGGVFK